MTSNAALVLEEDLVIPAEVFDLPRFQRWSQSAEFPEHGRIDFLDGRVEVDLSPEDLYAHSAVKAEIGFALQGLIVKSNRGVLFLDRARLVSLEAGLSAEPDLVAVLWSTLQAGRVREVPAARAAGRYVELEGAPDLVVEILSDSSEKKDRERLPPLYAKAGIPELWLIDARQEGPAFEIRAMGPAGYSPLSPGPEGWLSSPVLGHQVRLVRRSAGPLGRSLLTLEHR